MRQLGPACFAAKRGKWVMEQLLCDAPPPAPPGVEGLPPEGEAGETLRERLEAHRASEACAGCHEVMDQIGFGLEKFDPVGAYRETDLGLPVDATGVLPGGVTFDGAVELSTLLARDDRFPHCFAEHLMTYALGRVVGAADDPILDQLVADLAARGGTMRALVTLIATSDAFRFRRGNPEAP